MSTSRKHRPKPVDLPRVEAARAKLDELVARFPGLTSRERQERLAKHLGDEADEKGDGDGSEEDGGK
jgi:hypothetical protein